MGEECGMQGEKKWIQGVCGGTKKTTRGRSSRKLNEILYRYVGTNWFHLAHKRDK